MCVRSRWKAEHMHSTRLCASPVLTVWPRIIHHHLCSNPIQRSRPSPLPRYICTCAILVVTQVTSLHPRPTTLHPRTHMGGILGQNAAISQYPLPHWDCSSAHLTWPVVCTAVANHALTYLLPRMRGGGAVIIRGAPGQLLCMAGNVNRTAQHT